ncbi:MAG: hypothetical protein IVW57_16700, partial [Ktedonobacterales bacterium]|nr:hypothetical protein [Ktedonobacterales bacterium]
MSQSPPAPLLRLREADIVRLCGLGAAARGLELASHHAITRGRRDGARLEATVEDDGACAAWIELRGEPAPAAIRWGCVRHRGDDDAATPGALGCAHVASILTAWLRHPEDFHTDASAAPPVPTSADETAARPHLRQPALLAAPRTARPRGGGTLAEELGRLPAGELVAMARRVLGMEPNESEARALLAATLANPIPLNALVARLEPEAGALLSTIVLVGGGVTSADLDALAQRSGRAVSAVRAEATLLERHGLLFRVTGAAPASRAHTWRQLAGWRVPPEIRASLAPTLPIEPLGTPHDAAGPPLLAMEVEGAQTTAHTTAHTTTQATKARSPRIERATPHTTCLALALLAHAPAPLGPLAPPAVAARPVGTQRPANHAFALVAGDLAPERLAELARGAGLAPGLARLARRVLLWAREREPGQPLTNLAAMPPAEHAHALRAGFRLWLTAESPAELADLDLAPGGVVARYDPTHLAFRPAALAAEIAEARGFVVRVVALAQTGAWYALDALLDL